MLTDLSSTFRLSSPSHVKLIREAVLRYADGAYSRTDFFEQRGLPEGLVEKYKLGVVVDPIPIHAAYEGRICVPYANAAGIHFADFRCPCTTKKCVNCANGKFKYLAPTGEYRPLYNSWVLDRDLDVVYVSEGQLNAAVATYYGFPCIGAAGTRYAPHWEYLFGGLGSLVLLKDGDGNVDAAKNMARVWEKNMAREENTSFSTIEFPRGHDVASYHKEFGPEALKQFIGGVDRAD